MKWAVCIVSAFCSLLVPADLSTAQQPAPLGSGFSFQGQLREGGVPFSGTTDLEFTLWDAEVGGTQIGATLRKDAVTVGNGLFTCLLDFGADAFNGQQRWLAVRVRAPAGAGSFTALSPRQAILAAPYALYALRTPNGSGGPHDHFGEQWDGSAAAGLAVTNHDPGGSAIIGHVAALSGQTYGAQFTADSPDGIGLSASAPSLTGETIAGTFLAASPQGVGVSGYAAAETGPAIGGHFSSDSSEGAGLYAEAAASSGQTYGGYFESASSSGTAIYGETAATQGHTTGGYFLSRSSQGMGVYAESPLVGVAGVASGTSDTTWAGLFSADSPEGFGVKADAPFIGVWGEATAVSGAAYGGSFLCSSPAGVGAFGEAPTTGVRGHATATSGQGAGGSFSSESSTGMGVYGEAPHTGVLGRATAASGEHYGGSFSCDSPTGLGLSAVASGTAVRGQSTNSYSNSYGGYFTSGRTALYAEAPYIGLEVRSTASQYEAYAGRFTCASTGGKAIYAETTATGTAKTMAGQFVTKSTGDLTAAVSGWSQGTSGITYGGEFSSDSRDGIGVRGNANNASGSTVGGYFQTASPNGTSVYGYNMNPTGLTTGVHGLIYSNQGTGVFGWCNANNGNTKGVYGKVNSPLGYAGYFDGGRGIYASGGGYIAGDLTVTGNISATNLKTFVEPHPTDPNKEIAYVALEGPEAGTYVRGTAELVDGQATIALPEHFTLVTAEEGLTAQLTPLGGWLRLYVVEQTSKTIVVREASGKNGRFNYLVQGVRNRFRDYQPVRQKATTDDHR